MKYADELSAAVEAAEHELQHLDHCGVLVVTEIEDYGLQIALSPEIDPVTVRAALRGAADALEGKRTPLLSVLIGELKTRGWKRDSAGGWHHLEHPDLVYTSLVEVIHAQSMLEIARA